MSTLLLTRPGRDAITAGSSRPGQAQSHARGRGLRAAPAQPRLRARRHRHDPSAWCSCQAARDERRSRAVCRAAVRDPGLLNVPGPPKRPDGRFSATWRRLQQTFPILKYEQLLKRVAGTFVLVAFARLGHFMPVEGIDPFAGQYTPGGLQGKLYGSSAIAADLFMLGVTPLVDASIMYAGAMALFPRLKRHTEKLHEDRGREGAAEVKRYMRWLSLAFAIVMAVFRAVQLRNSYALPNLPIFGMAVTLAAGTALHMLIADNVELHGLGDGTSFLICLSIVSGYIQVLARAVAVFSAGAVTPATLLGIGAVYVGLVLASVYVTELELRLPLTHYRTPYVPPGSLDGKPPAPLLAAEHLSLRVNPNGMLPMILASVVVHALPSGLSVLFGPVAGAAVAAFQRSVAQPILFCVAVFFADFTSLAQQTPKRLAQYLQALDTGIKGVTPGPDTEEYLAKRERELRTLGGLSMAALAAVTQLFDAWCQRTLGVAIGTLSLLLLVGLVTSAVRQVTALVQEPRLESMLQRERNLLMPQLSS